MNYTKKVMHLSELKQMGITEKFLRHAYADKHQTFAWRSDPTKPNSPIMFDTEGLEEYRLKQVRTERLMLPGMGVV